MSDVRQLHYECRSQAELNLSYIPFVNDGGFFIPLEIDVELGEMLELQLILPGNKPLMLVEAKVIWITPHNALYHPQAGIGVQFVGLNAKHVRDEIKSHLDKDTELGGYVYGSIVTAPTFVS